MLMSAWASAPEKLNLSSDNGRERALAVEGLLKRMIDERRAGNTKVVAVTEDYNAVMKAWSMSGEGSKAAVRAEQVRYFYLAMVSVYFLFHISRANNPTTLLLDSHSNAGFICSWG